jgi:tetratricopeptide (TPR) repeat protein
VVLPVGINNRSTKTSRTNPLLSTEGSRNGDALGEFQRSLALFPSAQTESNLSETFFYLKRNRLGARHARLAIELGNQSADNLVQTGARLQKIGHRALALQAFPKAIAVNPRSIRAHLKLGSL